MWRVGDKVSRDQKTSTTAHRRMSEDILQTQSWDEFEPGKYQWRPKEPNTGVGARQQENVSSVVYTLDYLLACFLPEISIV